MNTPRTPLLLALLALLGLALVACGPPRRGGSSSGSGSDDDDDAASDDDDDGNDGPFSGSVEALLQFTDFGKNVVCTGTGSVERIGDVWFGDFTCSMADWGTDCSGSVDLDDGDTDQIGTIQCDWMLEETGLRMNEFSRGATDWDLTVDGNGSSVEFGAVDVTVELNYTADAS